MKRWWRVGAALLSGVGMALLVPPFDWGGLVWVVLLPLLLAVAGVEGRRAWKGFGLGWLAGFAHFAIGLHWLTTVTAVGWIVLAGFLALYPALWGALVARCWRPWRDDGARHWVLSGCSLIGGLMVAGLWCGQEWLRGWVFTGFGWNTLGVAFHAMPVMAQGADLLGVIGLSFVPVLLQAVGVSTGMRLVREARAGRIKPHPDFGVAVLLVALAVVYGVLQLRRHSGADGIRLEALLVQLNIPQEAARRLWSPQQIHLGYEEETLKALRAIDEDNARRFHEDGLVFARWPDWVVWPESSLTGRLLRTEGGEWGMWEENMLTLGRVREVGDFTMILGLNEIEAETFDQGLAMKEDARIWNSLVVIPAERELDSHRKHHLVIFGEYIPFVDQLPFLAKIYEQQSGASFGQSFSKGGVLDPLPVEVDGEELGVIPSICFEDTVPRLMRKFVRDQPQVIVNVTNDGWFKRSPAAAQHYANSKFRAIELRRPMIRCANTGVSAAVGANGSSAHPRDGERRELRDESGDHLTRGWKLVELWVPREPATTLYARIGDWGVIGLGLVGLGVAGRRWRR